MPVFVDKFRPRYHVSVHIIYSVERRTSVKLLHSQMSNEIANANSFANMSCVSYENTLQIYSFLSTSAQELAEICYKKLQIANFSAVDARKWWKIWKFRDFFKSSMELVPFI